MKLKISNLKFGYNKTLFENLNVECTSGDILCILGPNGCGKTTLVNCILHNIKKYQGQILFDDKDNCKLSVLERSKIVSYVDSKNDDINLEVFDYLLLGVANQKKFYEVPSKEDYIKVTRAINDFNISQLKRRTFSSLSDGEKKIVKICKAYIQETDIIILDEPTSSLDLKNESFVLSTLKKLANKNKIIIDITHDPNHCFYLNDKVLLLGKNIKYGDVDDIINEENINFLFDTEIKIVKDENENKRVFVL